MKDEEGVHERNRGWTTKGFSWYNRVEITRGERGKSLQQRKGGKKNHTKRTQTLALSHSLSHSLSPPTQLSGRPVLAFSHLACIGDTCIHRSSLLLKQCLHFLTVKWQIYMVHWSLPQGSPCWTRSSRTIRWCTPKVMMWILRGCRLQIAIDFFCKASEDCINSNKSMASRLAQRQNRYGNQMLNSYG